LPRSLGGQKKERRNIGKTGKRKGVCQEKQRSRKTGELKRGENLTHRRRKINKYD